MTDEITMTHTCGGKIVIADWSTEWTKRMHDTLVIVYICEQCEAEIEKRL